MNTLYWLQIENKRIEQFWFDPRKLLCQLLIRQVTVSRRVGYKSLRTFIDSWADVVVYDKWIYSRRWCAAAVIRDMDTTLAKILKAGAAPGSTLSGATISFDLPDAAWRGALTAMTVNCYLYDVRENLEMRTGEALVSRSADGHLASRALPPVRIDCAYCITAWSIAQSDSTLEEHDLLSQVLVVLLRNPTIPAAMLQGALAGQIAPYPTVIAAQDGIAKHHPQFWTALDQKLRPSLNYVATLAMPVAPPVSGPTPFASVVIAAGLRGAPTPPSPVPAPTPATPVIITFVET